MELDEALDRLAQHDQRKVIVQLLYFGGMTYEETADALRGFLLPPSIGR